MRILNLDEIYQEARAELRAPFGVQLLRQEYLTIVQNAAREAFASVHRRLKPRK